MVSRRSCSARPRVSDSTSRTSSFRASVLDRKWLKRTKADEETNRAPRDAFNRERVRHGFARAAARGPRDVATRSERLNEMQRSCRIASISEIGRRSPAGHRARREGGRVDAGRGALNCANLHKGPVVNATGGLLTLKRRGGRFSSLSPRDLVSRILLCDDEELVRWSLREFLSEQGYDVIEAETGEAFLEQVERTGPDLAILDLMLPGISGLESLRRLREKGNDLPVIMLTAVGTASPIVEATKLGAAQYITKPFDLDAVGREVEAALASHASRTQLQELGKELPNYAGIIGASSAMQRVFDALHSLTTVDPSSVLITGESGTGKDLVARAIHDQGVRASGPFVEVDCTAIPESLMESTLFGHERGAFTDAKAMRRGLFEEASDGIVFLDEIGELPLALQSKLLRALENRTFKRVGGNANISLRASVVAATNRNLLDEVKAGRFRQDLYYRLAVVEIHVPPLRMRQDDVRLLTQHFVQRRGSELGKEVEGVTAEALDLLAQYPWEGNVRELRNTIERVLIFCQSPVIDAEALPPQIRYATPAHDEGCPFVLPENGVKLDAVERGLVIQALDRTEKNQTAAADLLGISRYALRTRMKKYGLL